MGILNRLSPDRATSAAWGENIIKIASYEDTLFTYAMDLSMVPWQVTLYSREGEGVWQKGETIPAGNPPNLFVNSQGYVHLIGTAADRFADLRIFHIRFNLPNTVSGPYTLEYITPKVTMNRYWEEVFGSGLYNGAAIGDDDTILVAHHFRA